MIGVLAAMFAGGMYGCADHSDPDPPLKPTVKITAGPIEGGTTSYAIRIEWEGSDRDGIVERFEYAVDPSAEFTEAEIEGKTTTVTVETLPGQNGEPDVTRISKVVGGEVISFDWVHTREFSRLFRFTTPEADSTWEDGRRVPTGRFSGMHAIYVRAVDNGGAHSDPDKVAFTAETVAPTATIVRPNIEGDYLHTGPMVVVEWEGTDPDGHETDDPVAYLFKLLRLDTLVPPISPFSIITPEILFWKGGPWTLQSSESPATTLELGVPGQYVFGVRAVDEPGAIEPFLEWGRNAFRFSAIANGGRPTLTLSCFMGTFTFRGIAPPQEVELPQDTDLACSVQCNADEYGEQCNEFSWGLDLPDIEQEEGWSEWSTETELPPIRFPSAGIRVLYVRARDTLGSITLGTLIINVIEFPFDRDVLYVDDSFDDRYPTSSDHDEFWRARLRDHGFTSWGEFHAHGDNDRGNLSPLVPTLEDLGRYKMVLWECRGSGYNGATALLKVTETRPVLATYLRGGGKLWLGGRMTVAATIATASGLNADLVYPKEELGPGDFAWDFLKLHSSRINNDKARDQNGRNNIAKAIPFPGRPETYPEMDVDISKLSLAAQTRGVSHADAVFDPIFAHSEPDFEGIIDSLYTYGSTAVHLMDPPSSSTYENRMVALRWHDPDPDRDHGRVQWFGFPLYFFEDSQAQETFNRSMDWFREEQTPASSIERVRP